MKIQFRKMKIFTFKTSLSIRISVLGGPFFFFDLSNTKKV